LRQVLVVHDQIVEHPHQTRSAVAFLSGPFAGLSWQTVILTKFHLSGKRPSM
jgi:hypothetical protein